MKKTNGISYNFDVRLDTKNKSIKGKEVITWTNKSNVSISELRLYMYLNSFKNLNSTFLKGSNGIIFGSDIKKRNANEWGYVNIEKVNAKLGSSTYKNQELSIKFIQEDDGNKDDESVIQILLPKSIKPGETIVLSMDIDCKLPKFIARAGYSRDDFYAFLHWFPQMGVFEKNALGIWDWNCHQFFRQTEFFADFSDFNVNLTLPKHFKIAHTGCLIKEIYKGDNKILSIEAKDVIDFAIILYPYFEEYKDTWQGIDIKMFIPVEHKNMAPRYMLALKNALDFFNERIGKYPYPSITLMDPPLHGMGSGFMEYPMMITCASFCYVPKGIRTIESLAVHEFSHQFFMGILATNEKEEAWMDEGFVNFFEDEIMDHFYGRKNSMFDLYGFQSGNKERSRDEYISLADYQVGPIAQPGWKFEESYYKELVYAKTSLILQTLKAHAGEKNFYRALKNYYDEFKFTHPKEKDFTNSIKKSLGDTLESGLIIDSLLFQGLHTTKYCDYYLESFSQNEKIIKIKVGNYGKFHLPFDIKINFLDGSNIFIKSIALINDEITLNDARQVESVTIDPEQKNYLDVNFLNNSYSIKREVRPAINYAVKISSWWQLLLQSISYLI
jgi:hypothetical protein